MTSMLSTAEFAASLAGFYVQVPFCARKCGYCDFAAFAGIDELIDDYVDALRLEIEQFFDECRNVEDDSFLGKAPGTTLYIGGGTPTLLEPSHLVSALEPLLETDPVEVSIEANPETLDRHKASQLAHMGVSRVSLGVQSFDPEVLAYLDRTHDIRAVASAVDALEEAGISNFNLDLIYGAPIEDLSSWERTLGQALAYGPTHISCYALSVERGTPLFKRIAHDGEAAPCPDDQASKMELAARLLEAEGYVRYEVSSWALPGYECLHNLIYWGFGRYRGFGSGAHSFDGSTRFWNPRHPLAYTKAVCSGELPAGQELLDADTLVFDRISLGLRRSVGVVLPQGGVLQHTERLLDAGLAVLEGNRLRPTPKGMSLLNELIIGLESDYRRWSGRFGCVLSLSGSG
jgi:putative oxygen-independent coproporphyrinogen III oxidase